jgi:hypothetical protein
VLDAQCHDIDSTTLSIFQQQAPSALPDSLDKSLRVAPDGVIVATAARANGSEASLDASAVLRVTPSGSATLIEEPKNEWAARGFFTLGAFAADDTIVGNALYSLIAVIASSACLSARTVTLHSRGKTVSRGRSTISYTTPIGTLKRHSISRPTGESPASGGNVRLRSAPPPSGDFPCKQPSSAEAPKAEARGVSQARSHLLDVRSS